MGGSAAAHHNSTGHRPGRKRTMKFTGDKYDVINAMTKHIAKYHTSFAGRSIDPKHDSYAFNVLMRLDNQIDRNEGVVGVSYYATLYCDGGVFVDTIIEVNKDKTNGCYTLTERRAI